MTAPDIRLYMRGASGSETAYIVVSSIVPKCPAIVANMGGFIISARTDTLPTSFGSSECGLNYD